MSFTINVAKELAVAPRPLVMVDVVFPSGAAWYISSLPVTFNSHTYEARIDDPEMDRLASLSEQGIDRVPSVSVKIADPDGTKFATYERGQGFKGSVLTMWFALYDVSTNTFSTDSLVPFVGRCDQPSSDAQYLTVNATARLNLTRFMLPAPPIQENCLHVNPITVAQRAEANTPGSKFFGCGETLSLAAAPPCSYTRQSCTRPLRFSGDTYKPSTTGTGREYTSGNWQSWVNVDTSGKHQEFWPLWLGGKGWLTVVPLNQRGDGNFTRGEAAVGFGAVTVERVVVNGVELSQGAADFRWAYTNNGARDGAANLDIDSTGNSDPYGGETVIEYFAPKSVIGPASLPQVQVLGGTSDTRAFINITTTNASNGPIHVHFGRPTVVTDPGDGYVVTIAGNSMPEANGTFTWRYDGADDFHLEGTFANGSGTGGTVAYNNRVSGIGFQGGVPTPGIITGILHACGITDAELDASSFSAVSTICSASITVVDGVGASQPQGRFSSSMALRQRRSAAELVRGLRQSIGALLVTGPDGKIRLQIEGPIAEQQSSAVDGSNNNTAISSKTRAGVTTNGFSAYAFNESNSWGLKRGGMPIASMPNRVSFPFQDSAQTYAISQYSLVDPDDVMRVGQETPGGLQVQPEGIASYNHAMRCAKLGLSKIHRGNPANDTSGTDWWEWSTSFRGCKLTIGQIVDLTNVKYGMSRQMVRLTEIKPSRNYETVDLKGHFHNDDWYLDSHGNSDDPLFSTIRRERLGPPPAPTFAVEASALDPTVAEVTGLTFPYDANLHNITSVTFAFYYVDEAAAGHTLAANLLIGASSATLDSATDVHEGDYLQIGAELVLCGIPAGAVVPITRAQLGSTAAAGTSGDVVRLAPVKTQTATFAIDFFLLDTSATDWFLEQALPEMKLVSVGAFATNNYGPSPNSYVILTGSADLGLRLNGTPAGSTAFRIVNVTNTNTTLTPGNQIVSVVATTVDVTITLPAESADVGLEVIVKRAAGSTHNVIVHYGSGDTIDGSATDVTLDATTTVWAGVGQ